MLYIGYLIISDGRNIKKSGSEISIFELPRLENYTSTLCPSPLLGAQVAWSKISANMEIRQV